MCRPPVAASMLHRDASILDFTPLLGPIENGINSPQLEIEPRDMTFPELLENAWSCCSTLVITIIPSFLVASWFTHVGTNWLQLPRVLFYTRIGSDFCGRIATILLPPVSVRYLSIASFLRLLPVIIFFANASSVDMRQWRDYLSILLVGIIAFLSGYLVTGCFQLAPGLLQVEMRQKNVSKQASLLNVSFSLAAICGLLSSFALIHLGL
jgi:hypothetical protein